METLGEFVGTFLSYIDRVDDDLQNLFTRVGNLEKLFVVLLFYNILLSIFLYRFWKNSKK